MLYFNCLEFSVRTNTCELWSYFISNNGNCWYSDVLIVKKISWVMVSYIGLAFGIGEKSPSLRSKSWGTPSQIENFRSIVQWEFRYTNVIIVDRLSFRGQYNLVLSTELIMWIGHGRKEIRKPFVGALNYVGWPWDQNTANSRWKSQGTTSQIWWQRWSCRKLAYYCKFPLRSIIKINNGQSALHTDGTIVRWRVKLLKYYISEDKANSFVEATVAFVEKVSIKEHRGLASL